MQWWIAWWKEQIHQEATEEAFSGHRMVFKIHKNIKSSLRETIKGRDPRSTSNTILSRALDASAHFHPPPSSSPAFPCQIFFFFLSAFSSRSPTLPGRVFCFGWRFLLPLFHSGPVPRQVVCCLAGDVRPPEADPSSPVEMFRRGRRRRGAERTSSCLMQFWHSALADGAGCGSKTTTSPHGREKPHSLPHSHSNAPAT